MDSESSMFMSAKVDLLRGQEHGCKVVDLPRDSTLNSVTHCKSFFLPHLVCIIVA